MARYFEPNRAGEAIVWEVASNYCRDNLVIADSGEKGLEPGTILTNPDGSFRGMLIHGIDPDEQEVLAAAIVRGPAELREPKLFFPVGIDGSDAGADADAETALLRETLIEEMAAKLIILR